MRHRIRALQQLEHSDCGITCIRIISDYYGNAVPLSQLRKLCDLGRIGTSVRDLQHCATAIGMKAQSIKVGMTELQRMPLPAILYWDQRHFVVLYELTSGHRYKIADPSRGKIILRESDFRRHWLGDSEDGIALVMGPTDDFYKFKPEDEEKGSGLVRLLLSSTKKNYMSFIPVFCFSLIAVTADALFPVLFQKTVDEGIQSRDVGLVWMLILGQLCLFLGSYVSGNIIDFILTKLGLKVSKGLVNDYLRKLISFPISFIDRKVSSDLIQKVEDQNRIKNFLISLPDTVFLSSLSLIVFSTLLIYYEPVIFVLFIASTLMGVAWTRLFLPRRRSLDQEHFSYYSENRNNVYEMVLGMSDIKANNAQNMRVNGWNKLQEKINILTLKLAHTNMLMNGGNVLVCRLRDLAITGLCATFVIKGHMTLGVMMTVHYVAGRLSEPFTSLLRTLGMIQDASISYDRLEEVLGEPACQEKVAPLKGMDFTISLNNVSFKYPGSFSPYVIRNVSTTIQSGKVTAIVGASGSGKSTLIKLLLGFYIPQEGSVKVGGQNLAGLDNADWMSHCGAVLQSGQLFSGTILENIALSDHSPNINRAVEAAKLACIDSFIASLPMGYYTNIGVAGVELSGGQRQRLHIARALYKRPDVLFLDEATSSLDANNERKIMDKLTLAYQGRTLVVAAHRLSTICMADNILFLENGMIVEQGSHENLMTRKGKYYSLFRDQIGV